MYVLKEDVKEIIDNNNSNKEKANQIAIETDKKLLEDLKQTQKRYYWAGKTLFIEFNYEINEVKFYDYNKDWVEIFWSNFYFDFICQIECFHKKRKQAHRLISLLFFNFKCFYALFCNHNITVLIKLALW